MNQYEDQEIDLGLEYKVDYEDLESENSEVNEDSKIDLEEEKDLELNKVNLIVRIYYLIYFYIFI